jgi:hypothetical protein
VEDEAVLDVADVDTVAVESVVDAVEVVDVVEVVVDPFPVETPPHPPRSGTTTVPSASILTVHLS